MRKPDQSIWSWIVGVSFLIAGANHFANPEPYLAMMPRYLPAHLLLVQLSGLAEILGGIGLIAPLTRRLASWGLIVLLIAVFPANVNVALNGWPGFEIPGWILWARLPLQLLFVYWVYRIRFDTPTPSEEASSGSRKAS